MSAGLTGYAATVDRAWRDGVEIAIATLNARGGIMGRKIELVVEDNRSEPQEAVTVYRKMITSDKVNVFDSGCVSAGNFAAAAFVARAEIPMVLCSILPQQPDHVKWAFTTIPPPRFEIETRLEYLKNKTQIKKIGVLHDPSPYANAQKAAAEKEASQYGLEIVGIDQYRTDDADLSVQIQKMYAAGARALLKIGLGGTTLTAANNIKQLGLDMIMLTSLEDIAVFRPVAAVLGDKFFFVASPAQVYDALPDGQALLCLAGVSATERHLRWQSVAFADAEGAESGQSSLSSGGRVSGALAVVVPGGSGDLCEGLEQDCAHDRVMLRLRAVADMARAELVELRDDRFEVAKRLAQEDEGAEQHRLLPLQVGAREERLHRGCGGEEPCVEHVHELVAARGDEVEAGLECLEVEGHLTSPVSCWSSQTDRADARARVREAALWEIAPAAASQGHMRAP